MRKFKICIIFTIFTLITVPGVAQANAIIPYLWVPFAQVILFPLVVVLETWIVKKLIKLSFIQALWRIFLANLASTGVGAAVYFTTMPIIGSPLRDIWIKFQTIAAISISLLIAMILLGISWFIETAFMTRLLHKIERPIVSIALFRANLVTYILLWIFSVLDALY